MQGVKDGTGRRALITGGGSGIGAATAVHLARAGWRVAILDIDGLAASRIVQRVGPGQAIFREGDVVDPGAILRKRVGIDGREGVRVPPVEPESDVAPEVRVG